MHFLGQPASYGKKKTYEVHEVLGEGTFGKVVHASAASSRSTTAQNVPDGVRLRRARHRVRASPSRRPTSNAACSTSGSPPGACPARSTRAAANRAQPAAGDALRDAACSAHRPPRVPGQAVIRQLLADDDSARRAGRRPQYCPRRARQPRRALPLVLDARPSPPARVRVSSPSPAPTSRPLAAFHSHHQTTKCGSSREPHFALTRLARTNSPPVAFLAAKHDALNELFTTALTAQQSRVGQFSGTNGSRYLLETNGSPCSTATTRS